MGSEVCGVNVTAGVTAECDVPFCVYVYDPYCDRTVYNTPECGNEVGACDGYEPLPTVEGTDCGYIIKPAVVNVTTGLCTSPRSNRRLGDSSSWIDNDEYNNINY